MLDTHILLNILPRIQIENMPKTTKVKKKITKTKSKIVSKIKKKVVSKLPLKISKTYIPKDTEKYMCEKHKVFFRIKLTDWKKELVKANNELKK